MDATSTAKLVERIIATWPAGPRGHIWTAAIADLDDPTRARQVLDQLTTTAERPPSVAQFLNAYRASQPRAYGFERPADTGQPISRQEYLALHPDDTNIANATTPQPPTTTSRR